MTTRSSAVVFQGVRVFDGRNPVLSSPTDVIVRGNTIEAVRPTDGSAPVEPGARVVPGAGRALMPGLIDAHWHPMFAAVTVQVAMTADPGYVHLAAGREAERTLLRGFTSVRDAGGRRSH